MIDICIISEISCVPLVWIEYNIRKEDVVSDILEGITCCLTFDFHNTTILTGTECNQELREGALNRSTLYIYHDIDKVINGINGKGNFWK
jgi:hypothetical protein